VANRTLQDRLEQFRTALRICLAAGEQWEVGRPRGYGVFYEHPFAAGVPNVASLGFETAANVSSPDNGVTPAFYMRNGIQVVLKPPVRDSSFGAVPVGRPTTTSVTYFERDRRTGYAQQFNLGIQRQLPGDIVAEVSYLGASTGRSRCKT